MKTLIVLAYGVTIIASAMCGGYLPQIIRMNHVRMQVLLSFVGGMMLGVAVFLLLPHGFLEIYESHLAANTEQPVSVAIHQTVQALLVGLLFTFFMMRAFHFHQHGTETGEHHHHDHLGHDHSCSPAENIGVVRPTRLGWLGVIFGLGLHTFIDGIALGAAVLHDLPHMPAGFGVYLAILLHKPLDAISLSALMAAENRSWRAIQIANVCFGLMCLLGALATIHWPPLATGGFWLGSLLAASTGIFLCISLSDLLPEVQFHRHDRLQLSAAMLAGVGIAFLLEISHSH